MRYIAIALLAMMVATAAMAADPVSTGSSSLIAGEQTYWATYNGDWSPTGQGSGNTNTYLDVTAVVPYFASETVEAAGFALSFTRAVEGSALRSGALHNDADCNFPFRIYLAPTLVNGVLCNIELMKWVAATNGTFANTDGAGSNTMAVKWLFQADGDVVEATVPGVQLPAGTVEGPTFTSGAHDFDWFVEVTPNENQKPGNYKLDPAVVIAPAL